MYTTTVDQPGFSVHRSSTSERRRVPGAFTLLVQQILTSMHRAACSLRGHDLMMEFAPKRLSLRCVACGYNTPGWEIDVKLPPLSREPRVRVVARTAPAVVMTAVTAVATVKGAVTTQPLPAQSHADDHASAA